MFNRKATKSLAMVAVFLIASLSMTGCTSQATIAALINQVGVSVQSLLVIESVTDPALSARIQADFTAASTAVLNWKKGTPAQDVIQALNIVQADINLIPLNPVDQALIVLAIGTVNSILALLPGTPAAATASASFHAPKNAKEFKKQWNAIVAANPSLARAAQK